jgi:hypothetical protein
MRKEREDQLDPAQPSLLVTYGNTTRKVRPLDRELLVLGRAATCDINLVSPEIASIHALILRAAEGWRVRDCGSRLGTRLNGRAIQESQLEDGDVLQIGSFSFHLNLPGKSAHGTSLRPDRGASIETDSGPPPQEKKLGKLQRSRRHLAELALSLRRRCRGFQEQAAAARQAEALVEERHADLSRQREALRNQQDGLEQRAAQLLQLEQELNARLQAVEHELTEFQDRQEQAEGDAQRRQAEVDARIRMIQEREAAIREAEASFAPAAAELEKLRAGLVEKEAELACRAAAMEAATPAASFAPAAAELEKLRADLVEREAEVTRREAARPAAAPVAGTDAVDECARRLARRQEELNRFAAYLRRTQEQLAERERALVHVETQWQGEVSH